MRTRTWTVPPLSGQPRSRWPGLLGYRLGGERGQHAVGRRIEGAQQQKHNDDGPEGPAVAAGREQRRRRAARHGQRERPGHGPRGRPIGPCGMASAMYAALVPTKSSGKYLAASDPASERLR